MSRDRADTLPCRHPDLANSVGKVKDLLQKLPQEAPDVLAQKGISATDYPDLLRAAVESLRGTASATTSSKTRFIKAVLDYGVERKVIHSHTFTGSEARQDHKVVLPDGTRVAIEAKGCPDGNNMNIWDRPGWADEFIVWSQCPESLVKQPGWGVWSGVATRLLPKMTAERTPVTAMFFWDARCGSDKRRCPKNYGITGETRKEATDIPAQDDKPAGWIPPPCIYLFPRSAPHVANNPKPPNQTLQTCKFAKAMLDLFNVPEDEQDDYVHEARIQAKAGSSGVQILPSVRSRCWPDGQDRVVQMDWKTLRRE